MTALAEEARALLDKLHARHQGRIAVLSSFGTEAAVLLHLVAQVDRATPILFLDTERHFPETLAYRDGLLAALGLTGLILLRPDPREAAAEDADDFLWAQAPEACCALRKVRPLTRAMAPFDVLVDGRKRHHGGERAVLSETREEEDRLRVSPLAAWTPAQIEAYRRAHGLPAHPLAAKGYASIGCLPCTTPTRPDEPPRAGRWRGSGRTECGIHRPRAFIAPRNV